MNDDQFGEELRSALRAASASTHADTALMTRLIASVHEPTNHSRRISRTWLVPLLSAAVVAALVVGTLVLVGSNDHRRETPPAGRTSQPASSVSPSPSVATSSPTLGAVWTPGSQGFGSVRPTRIFNGGDPTGLLTNVKWSSWGGGTAIGTATGYYQAPDAAVASATPQQAMVEAFDLGTCHGKPAYLRLQWWFPAQGESFHPTGGEARYNLCTGIADSEQ